mgnify:CR=1 FL=1
MDVKYAQILTESARETHKRSYPLPDPKTHPLLYRVLEDVKLEADQGLGGMTYLKSNKIRKRQPDRPIISLTPLEWKSLQRQLIKRGFTLRDNQRYYTIQWLSPMKIKAESI